MSSEAVGAGDRGGLPAVLGAGLLIQIVATWSVLALAAIAPTVAASLGVPVVLIGYQIALIYTVGTVVSFMAGALVTRWGACRASQIVLVACAIASLIATLPTLFGIVIASVIVGAVYGLTNPSAAALLARNTSAANRSFVFSLKQTGVPLGGIAAGLATPFLAVTFGWQWAIAAIAPLALVLVLALIPFRASWDAGRRPDTPIGPDSIRGIGAVLSNPHLLFLCLFAFCFGAIQLSLMTFAVALAVEELGARAVLAGGLLALAQAAGVVGRLLSGFVADRIGNNVKVLITMSAVTTVGCLAVSQLGPDTDWWVIFALFAMLGSCVIGWNGVFLSEIVGHSGPERAGSATGIGSVFAFSGVIVGPASFVSLYAWLGSYLAVFGVLAIVAFIAGAGLVIGPPAMRAIIRRQGRGIIG